MDSKKLIFVSELNENICTLLNLPLKTIKVYRSKGLLSHLLKRKHFIAIKYLDFLEDILQNPDYIGSFENQIELVKQFKDNIFVSIKLDEKKEIFYISTIFDVSNAKIQSYCKTGRLKKKLTSNKLDRTLFLVNNCDEI